LRINKAAMVKKRKNTPKFYVKLRMYLGLKHGIVYIEKSITFMTPDHNTGI